MHNCKRCNIEIIQLNSKRKRIFCSHDCKWRFYYENKEKISRNRTCKCCDIDFIDISDTNQMKYCTEECREHFVLKTKYNISLKDYKDLKNKFPTCAICKSLNQYSAELSVDHCHKTGKIRWLLCKHCNRGLGAFFDDPNLLRKAADMLEAQK